MDWDELEREVRMERKELAGEKLIHDRESIQKKARVASDVDEVFPKGSFERFQNNQIWNQIFSFIINPVDILNASQTCKTFSEKLNQVRTNDRLPSVLRIFHDNEYSRLKRDWDNGFRDEHRAILGLRLISKSWKRAVETEFFERPFHSEDWHLSYNESDDYEDQYYMGYCEFSYDPESEADQVKNAISALNGSDSGNCFIRLLRIEGDHPDIDEDIKLDGAYFTRLIEFLDKHGHAVWGLTICYSPNSETYMDNKYEGMWEIANRTPNLKALSFEGVSQRFDEFDEDFEEHERLVRLTIREKLSCHPFPCIPSLRYFEFYYLFHESIIAIILRRNDQITALRLRNDPTIHEYLYLSNYFENIKQDGELYLMQLERFEGPYYGNLAFTYNDNWIGWPLKVVQLYMEYESETQHFWHDTFFPLVNHFGNTLQHLIVADDFIKIEKDRNVLDGEGTGNVMLNLPYLKTLHILVIGKDELNPSPYGRDNELIRLEHLVGLKSLEKLKVESLYPEETRDTSRFFKAFPKLKEVKLGFQKICLIAIKN